MNNSDEDFLFHTGGKVTHPLLPQSNTSTVKQYKLT